MKLDRSKRLRRLMIVALTLPLLASGSCMQITQGALINGFFDALTPILLDQVAQQLGLTSNTTTPTP